MSALVIDKEKIKEMLSEFPENVIIEDFIDRIILAAKIEKREIKLKRANI